MGMMINRRRVCGGKGLLPSGYTQVEYIENTSSAYIDTGIIPTIDTDTDITFQYTALPTNATMAMGCQQWREFGANNETYYDFISARQLTSTFSCNIFSGGWINSGIPCDTNKHVVKYRFIDNNNRKWSIDNNTYPITALGEINKQMRVKLLLFALNNAYSLTVPIVVDGKCKCKIFSFSQKRNGSFIINLIPCLSPDNKVGMYDLVEGRFYSSPNGVAFIAGNPV